MIKHAFSDFSYAINNESAKKGHKEILVCFIYNGVEVLKKVYIPEGDGIAYIFEAKKVIDKEMRNGSLTIYSRKFITKKKKEAAKKKKSAPKKITEVEAIAPIPPVYNNGVSWKKVVVICAAVALVVGIGAWALGHFLNKSDPVEPIPADECDVNVDFKHTDGKSIEFSGPSKAKIGEKYEANMQLKQELRTFNQIEVAVSMDGKILKTPTDYTFEATPADPDVFKLTIKKVTGVIIITPVVKNNSYFVNFTYDGTDVYTCNLTGSGEAPTTIAKYGVYQCLIKVNDAEKYSPDVGIITMDGADLTRGVDYKLEDCSPVDPTTKRLTISKRAIGNIQIVAIAKENTPSKYPIYFTSYGCVVPTDVTKIETNKNVAYTVHPDSTHTQHTAHIIVAVKNEETGVNKVLEPSTTTYKYDSTQSTNELTIYSEAITGTVYVTAIAIEDVTIANVVYDIGDKCEFVGQPTATVGNEYSCTIKPKDAYSEYEVEIVSVVMNGEPFADYDYSDNTLTISEVTGDIFISAYAKLPTSSDHKVSILYDADDITAEYSDTVTDGATDYSCTIKANVEATKWVRIVSITMSGDSVTKLVEGENYSYDREGSNEYQLLINTPITGNIIIVAIVEDRDKSTFNIEQYIWDCEFSGPTSFTPGEEEDYTGVITPSDLEYKTPKIITIKVGGTTLQPASDYTVTETNVGSNTWKLTIPYAKITTDVVIAIGTQPRERSSFHVTTYTYKCQSSDTTRTVLRDQQYKAKISAIDTDYEPNVFTVIMGAQVLSEGTDYKLDLKSAGEYNFVISKPAIDDIIICATVKSKSQHLGTPQFEKIEGENKARITGILPPAGEDKSDITEVEIPNKIEESSENGVMLDVVQIGKADGTGADILNGCGHIEKLSIPFIGKNLVPDSNPYNSLFGTIFGSKMYDGCLSLTWQDFYMNSEEDTGSYRIARAAIPSSLSTIVITGKSAIPQGAFSQCRYINKVVFYDYDTDTIGSYAFAGCSSLRKIDLPNSTTSGAKLTTIQWRAFENCYTLGTFSLRGIVNVNHHAFNGCVGISSIDITNSVAKIESGAFGNLGVALIETELSRTEVSAKVASGDWARDWADSGASVIYGFYSSEVFTDGDYRFIRVKIDDGASTGYGACIIEYLGDDKEYSTITLPATLTGDAIPEDENATEYEYPVVEIAAQVFYGYTRLQGVVFTDVKNTLNYIDSYAFTACTSLATLTGIEDTNLISISDYAFDRCPVNDTTDHILSFKSTLKRIGMYNFAYNTALEGIDLSDTQIAEVPEKLCYGCTSLKTVSLPEDKITKLGASAFENCSSLTSLVIPAKASIDAIPDSFCCGCTKLASFKLTNASELENLTTIGEKAFYNCLPMNDFNLTGGKNTLLDSVTTIGSYAFGNWTGGGSLTTFYIGEGTSLIETGVAIFENWGSGKVLHVDEAAVDQAGEYVQKSTTKWGWVMARNQGWWLYDDPYYTYYTDSCGSIEMPIYIEH